MKILELVELVLTEGERLASLVEELKRIFGNDAEITPEMIEEARRNLPPPLEYIQGGKPDGD